MNRKGLHSMHCVIFVRDQNYKYAQLTMHAKFTNADDRGSMTFDL